MRIRGYDEETEEYIGNVEELTGKIADLTKTANKPGGISLFKDAAKTEYKSTYELLKEISEIYHDLTDKQQAGLLEALAGKRGGQVLAGILEDFSEVEKAMTEMGQAAGSADDEMKIIEESISYKLNDLKETWIGLLQELLDRGAIDEIIDMLIKLSEAIVKVVEANPKAAFSGIVALLGVGKLGGFKGIADTISGLGDLANIFNKSSKSTKTIEELLEVLIKSGAAGETMAQGMEVAEVAMEGTGGAAVSLASSLAPLIAIAAVVAGGIIAWDAFTTTVEEAEEELNNTSGKIEDIKGQISELEALDHRSSAQQTRLNNLRAELDLQERLYAIEEKRRNAEKYGEKFSDYADSNSYVSKRISETNIADKNSLPNLIAQVERFNKEADNAQESLQTLLDESDSGKSYRTEAELEATIANVEERRDKAKEKRDKALLDLQEKELLYTQEIENIRSDLNSDNLTGESRKNAINDLNVYLGLLYQVQTVLDENAKKEGTYDYFAKDNLKELSNIWGSTSGMGSEGTYDALIEKTQQFSEEEKQVWYEAVKDASSYSEAIRLGEDAVNRLRGNIDNLTSSTSKSVAVTWDLGNALTRYNINQDDFDKYLATFKELNPEIADNQELLEQAAVANMAFDQSVEDLRSHLNDYVENLETLDKSSVEYANSLSALAQDLSGLTGIDFSITDAQNFASDINNLELLRQALDGDNEALNRLRDNANQMIIARIEAQTDINVDGFNEQYNELVNWIAENPNIGELEAQSYLDSSPFIQTCMDLIRQGKMTAQDLQKIFANLGWNITWDTKKMQVPKIMSKGVGAKKGEKVSTIYTNKGAQQVNWVDYSYELIDVPTNIRFEGRSSGNTAPKISKPTSSSGSNYKPSQKSGGGGGGGGSGSSKDPTEEAKKDEEELEDTYDEFFDYFERRLKVISDAVSLLDANLENVVGSKAKNSLLDAQMRLYKMQQQEYSDARDMYQEMADKALEKIPDNLREDVKNGAVAIDEFIGKEQEDVINAINDYTKWADKIAECKQQLAELKEQIRQLELNKMKNILQDWQDVFDLRQNSAIDLIDKQIALIEQTGEAVGDSFYKQQKSQSEKQLQALQKAKDELVAEFNRGLANGSIERGTDEWIEEVNLITQVEQSILDCKKAIDEFDNAILQIHTDVFERVQAKFDDFDDQLSDIASFIEDIDVGNKYGEWSKEGIARAGMLAQQYEMAQKRVADYSSEIAWLNQQYKLGKFSTLEYTEKLADLMSAQRDAAQDAKDYKDAIIDLNRARIDIEIDAIEKDIDAYNELIQKQKDALTAEKD